MKRSTSERTVEVTDALPRENEEMLQNRAAFSPDEVRLCYLKTLLTSVEHGCSQRRSAGLHFTGTRRDAQHPLRYKSTSKILNEVKVESTSRNILWEVKIVSDVRGDLSVSRLVVRNLLSNAVDNGVGFEIQYSDERFGIFQRLHNAEECEGTYGFASVRHIVDRHAGRMWVDAVVWGKALPDIARFRDSRRTVMDHNGTISLVEDNDIELVLAARDGDDFSRRSRPVEKLQPRHERLPSRVDESAT